METRIGLGLRQSEHIGRHLLHSLTKSRWRLSNFQSDDYNFSNRNQQFSGSFKGINVMKKISQYQIEMYREIYTQYAGTVAHKPQRKPKGSSRMDDLKTLATFGRQDTGRRQTNQKHNTDAIKARGVSPGILSLSRSLRFSQFSGC